MAKINKMIIGLIVLVGGVVTMIVLPSWGKWLADYPAQVAAGAPAYWKSYRFLRRSYSVHPGLCHRLPRRPQLRSCPDYC